MLVLLSLKEEGETVMSKIGFDKQCITPILPIKLCGYAKERIAHQVHDDLYTRVIIIENAGIRYLIAQCDLLAIDYLLLNKVHEKVMQYIDKENIIISATHTHAGYGGIIDSSGIFSEMAEVFGETDEKLIEFVTDQIACATKNSIKDLKETNIKIGKSKVSNIGKERHEETLPSSDEILVFEFTRSDDKKVLLYNYACHPTVTGPDNVMITKDLPYPVERDLPHDMVMFINGDCGDISTRFTRMSSSFEQVEIYSKIIIASINDALKPPMYEGAFTNFNIDKHSLDAKIRETKTIEEAMTDLNKYSKELELARAINLSEKELRVIESFVEGANTALALAKSLNGIDSVKFDYSLINIQNIDIVTIPGELFSTLGNKLRESNLEVFGYTNGYYLYIADSNAYDNQFYEAMSSPFKKGFGEELIKRIISTKKATLINLD